MKKELNDKDRYYLACSYRNKSMEALQDAEDLLEFKPGLSTRMSYEATYHSIVALFITEEISIPKTHRGLNSELYHNFVDTGIISKDIATYLGKLESDRNTSQYDPLVKISLNDAKKNLQLAKEFCDTIQAIVEKNLNELEGAIQNATNEVRFSNILERKHRDNDRGR
jgi:uncharacterized protein (UPF0332 family)